MQFVYPTFLFALAALAIPIILHLFYFRRFKKVYFTNVKFLKEVKEETSARSKLRNLMVLLMRLLALAFLIFAFAQPFIPQNIEVKKGNKAVSVFIDNSFSMEGLSRDVPLIEKAKQRAREIIRAYNVEDEFQILTNDFEGRHQRIISQEDALSLVDEIERSPAVKELSKVFTRQEQTLDQSTASNQIIYQISDFQRNITDISNFQDTSIEFNLVPLQSVQEKNVSLDSAWFDAPVQALQQSNLLLVKVSNKGDEDVDNIRLAMTNQGQTKPVGTLSIPAKSAVIDSVAFPILNTGWHVATLNVTDFPISFDDNFHIAFSVAEQVNVLVINEDRNNPYLDAAFSGITYFNVQNQFSRNIDYSQLKNQQFIITNELTSISTGLAFELSQFVKNGGNLLVVPSNGLNLGSYKDFLGAFPANEFLAFDENPRAVGSINTEEFVFKDVYENVGSNLKLPQTLGNFTLSNFVNRGEERLLIYRDGSTFLSKYQIDQGQLYLTTAPLDNKYNDLAQNGEIFIPMLYKMAISTGKIQRVAYTIGVDEVLESSHQGQESEIVYKIQGQDEEFIPQQRVLASKVILGINGQIRDAGIYDLFLKKDEILNKFAFNFDRKESNLEFYSAEDLKSRVGPIANVLEVQNDAVLTARIAERSQGKILWRWCIILMLIFLAMEILLLRFWKV